MVRSDGMRKKRRKPSREDSRSNKSRREQQQHEQYMDLMVMVPKQPQPLFLSSLLDRLESAGFTTVALTQTVYGPPPPPPSTIASAEFMQQLVPPRHRNHRRLRILTRLHAVVENLSDVGLYALKPDSSNDNNNSRVLQSYDLVSLSPRNDAVFQAACLSATAAEILTLDYTSSAQQHRRLPFKIRTKDVKAAVQRGVVFEIPYAPAILNPKARKAFIQTFRELQTASLGLKPKILLSSGDRQFNAAAAAAGNEKNNNEQQDDDVGALALRMPGDLINLLETVLHLDHKTAVSALTSSGSFTLHAARRRHFGEEEEEKSSSFIVNVSMEEEEEDDQNRPDQEKKTARDLAATALPPKEKVAQARPRDAGDDELCEDGFIEL